MLLRCSCGSSEIKKNIHLYGQMIHILDTSGYFQNNGLSVINSGLVRAVTNVKYRTKQLESQECNSLSIVCLN